MFYYTINYLHLIGTMEQLKVKNKTKQNKTQNIHVLKIENGNFMSDYFRFDAHPSG